MSTMASANGGVAMPSYNIRRSIAKKVADKKTAKGYTLSEESCTECEMPLMTLNGKSDCKVCPAIKKWVDRKNNEETTAARKLAIEDVRDEVVDAGREEEEDMREEEPVMDVDEDPTPRVGNFSALKVSESTESNTSSTYMSTSDETEDTDAIRARARQIIMSARGSETWHDDADDTDDDSDNGTSIQSSYTSSIKSTVSTDSSDSADEEAFIRDRAAAIINQARKNFHTEQLVEEEQSDDEPEEVVAPKNYPPPSISTPRALCPKKSASFEAEEANPGMGSWEAAIIIQSMTRAYIARKMVYGMLLREYEEEDQLDFAVSSDSSGVHFEPLGVNNPTDGTCDEGEEGASNEPGGDVQKNGGDMQEEDVQVEEVLVEDVTVEEETIQDAAVSLTNRDDSQKLEPTPQAQSDVIAKKPSEVTMSEDIGVQKKQNGPEAPSRGLLAELACKFDDVVTDVIGKVQSIVSCNPDVEDLAGFANAFEAEQCQRKYEAQLMLLNMRGWKDTDVPCPRCNKTFLVAPVGGHMMCAGCDDIGVEPTQQENDISQTDENPQPESQPEETSQPENAPVVEVPNQMYHIEMNRRIQLGWMAVNQGCPYCSAQLMRKPNDITDHCLACGPIFTPQANATPMMHQAPISAPPPPPPPPVQNCDPRDACAQSPKENEVIAPDQNQTLHAPIEDGGNDTKENASGDANVSKQLEDAKLRIDEAKKFIMNRNASRMTPGSRGSLQYMMNKNNMTPGVQAAPFRPVMSMLTPGSHGNAQPLMNMTPGAYPSKANKLPNFPGTQASVFRSQQPQMNTNPAGEGTQVYRSIGSLISAGAETDTETSAHHAAKMNTMTPGTQTSVEASQMGTPGSGHRTPVMPGKYFFA